MNQVGAYITQQMEISSVTTIATSLGEMTYLLVGCNENYQTI